MIIEAKNVDKITHGKGLENKEKEQCWKTHKIRGGGMKEEKLMKEKKKQ